MATPTNHFANKRASVITGIALAIAMGFFISRFVIAHEIKQWLIGISLIVSLLTSLLVATYYKSRRNKITRTRFWKYAIGAFIAFILALAAFFIFYGSFEKRMQVNVDIGQHKYETRDSVFIKGLYYTKEVKREIYQMKQNNPGGQINLDVVFSRSNREIDNVWNPTSRMLAQSLVLIIFILLMSLFITASTFTVEILMEEKVTAITTDFHPEISKNDMPLIFISHSSLDATIAFTIVSRLEESGFKCWIAPRDIPTGAPYAASIVQSIKHSQIMVVVFSDAANKSDAIVNEIENAIAQKLRLIPFKLDNEEYSDSLEYYLRTKQAVNAYDKSLDDAIDELVISIQKKTGQTTPA